MAGLSGSHFVTVGLAHQKRSLRCSLSDFSGPQAIAPQLLWLWSLRPYRGIGYFTARKGQTAPRALSANGPSTVDQLRNARSAPIAAPIAKSHLDPERTCGRNP